MTAVPSWLQHGGMNIVPQTAAAASRPLPITVAFPLGLGLKDFANGQLRQAEAFLACDGESLHAGIHQARKSIRRVRATLALGLRSIDPRAKRLDDDLGRLCRG